MGRCGSDASPEACNPLPGPLGWRRAGPPHKGRGMSRISAPLPDAAPTNWVDRHAPTPLRPWLKLGRFDRPVGIWLLLLPGWQGIALAGAEQGRTPQLWLFVAFLIGATLMRAAGCAFNDIVDRD